MSALFTDLSLVLVQDGVHLWRMKDALSPLPHGHCYPEAKPKVPKKALALPSDTHIPDTQQPSVPGTDQVLRLLLSSAPPCSQSRREFSEARRQETPDKRGARARGP